IADVAFDKVKGRIGTKVVEALLVRTIHEVVESSHLGAGSQKMFAKNAAKVTKAAGDEDALWHGGSLPWVQARQSRGRPAEGSRPPAGSVPARLQRCWENPKLSLLGGFGSRPL